MVKHFDPGALHGKLAKVHNLGEIVCSREQMGDARVAERLRDADLDRMTPIDALAFLAELRDEVGD